MKSEERTMDMLLQRVLKHVPDPSRGLPDAVFNFAVKITPMINVDLLVRNDRSEHLLAWREDDWGSGWHIPGGIIRYNEPIHERIAAVARSELSTGVRHSSLPVDIKQFFHRRGHFISLLFLCELEAPIGDRSLLQLDIPRTGALRWIQGAPSDLYSVHKVYSDWLNGRFV
ncbi:MAG: NUDIX hydrolase [Betaproteobacteria bacterium]|nr:MAG: NUDIX hydrolase [Betaproteobacteria bacterium]